MVKEDKKNKAYTKQLSRKFVNKRDGSSKWECLQTGRKGSIVDALMDNSYAIWTPKREFHLGAHIMNDLSYKSTTNTTPPNCVVQPLLEVVAAKDIKKGEELFLSYNRL